MHEIPLQIDLFTSEKVDTRTVAQKKASNLVKPEQVEMFSQADLAQFGVRANPQMSLSEHTRLILICEDPRTPEEIERDRERQAQSLTHSLFEETKAPDPLASAPLSVIDLIYSPHGLREDVRPEEETSNNDDELPAYEVTPLSKLTIYCQLVELAYERSITLFASKTILLSQRITASSLSCQARLVGLSAEEIHMAETIGEYRATVHKTEVKAVNKQVSTLLMTPFPQTDVLWKWTPDIRLEMSRF